MKQINVRVPDDIHAGITERAEAAGLSVQEYAKQVLADESNDLRHRFLNASAHFADAFSDAFTEEFGSPATHRGPAAAA
ncbi:toxin-antitoxin system HicB family antitoxin [Streptomyces sp. NPDC005195]|uniref:plasmid mobilization protein n=1 Tax=Streptomyces sp. NPDC005195 TaxID=3154561 RepID=UPI0033B56EA4